jgi:hypothetical protein
LPILLFERGLTENDKRSDVYASVEKNIYFHFIFCHRCALVIGAGPGSKNRYRAMKENT